MNDNRYEEDADLYNTDKKYPSTILSQKVIDYLREEGEVISFVKEETILKRGDPDIAFYVILSGEVEVRLTGQDGNYLSLTRLKKNSSFGEMALLREEPVSADVIALSSVRVLKYPKGIFFLALAESVDFRMELMKKMAQNVQDTSSEAWSFFQRVEAYNMLAQKEKNQHQEPLVSRSIKMRKVEKEICSLAQNSDTVLIQGEAGSGKLFISRKIHNLTLHESSPFIVIDCSSLGDFEARNILFGSSQLKNETEKLEGFGAIHLAHKGTLVLKHIDELDLTSQQFLLQYLDIAAKYKKNYFPDVKIIATTRKKIKNLEQNVNFSDMLLLHLRADIIRVPPLKERKSDLLFMANIFLKNLKFEKQKILSKNAENTLLSLNYMHNNVKELRESVELSALFCEQGDILAEHIFAGPKDKGLPNEYNLSEIPIIEKITNKKSLFLFRSVVLLFFLGIIGSCLFLSYSKIGIFANSLIWAFWEPALIFLFLFIGRVWCTICPLSTIALWLQNLFSLKKTTSLWIKKYNSLLIIAGLFLIFLSERVFQMTKNPVSSGYLLLILMSSAILFSLIYQREVWCRYICPLGALATGFSFSASLQLRAKPNICTTYCKTHECFKGTKNISGCSVFHHPLYISENYNCKLCFKCIDSCPHDAIQLYKRPFLKGVWFFGGFAKHLSTFAFSVFSLSIFMLLTNKIYKLNDPSNLIIFALLAIFFGFLLEKVIHRIMIPKNNTPDKAFLAMVSFAFMILAWGPLFSYQLSNIPFLSSIRIFTKGDSIFAQLFPIQDIPFLVILQTLIMFLATLLAMISFLRIRNHTKKEEIEINRWGWYFIFGLTFIYSIISIIIIV